MKLLPAALALALVALLGVLYVLRKPETSSPKPTSTPTAVPEGPRSEPPTSDRAPPSSPATPSELAPHTHADEEGENRAQDLADDLYPVEEEAPTAPPSGEVVQLPERPPPLSDEEKLARMEKLIPTLELRLKMLEEDKAAAEANRVQIERLRARIDAIKTAVREKRLP